ncbi:MAG: beta-glucosidase, partial [Chitinivibrionales bacterium]|nr:beta-glucosidase [Chitinivibrionales bacterium]
MAEIKRKYRDPSVPIEQRVDLLIDQMTTQEKLMQLAAVYVNDAFNNIETKTLSQGKLLGCVREGWGHFSCAVRYEYPANGVCLANSMQKAAFEETRLGIPVVIHDESLHGCMAQGSTSFPQAIGLAATWDPKLMERVASAIGRETAARGVNQALSPTINIARDKRCGRTEETYGEDPVLASRMAVAFIKSMQKENVICTPKHFVANFVGDGGRDSNDIHISERLLREIYFPAFEASIREGGALSLMSAYNTLDGAPCSANRWLLTHVLRNEWGFKGYVVSDYGSVVHLLLKHRTAATRALCAKKCLEAGLDIELPGNECVSALMRSIDEGELSLETLDENVRRVLYVKFKTGLFENPYVDERRAVQVINCDKHRDLAREAARRSMVLLKNDGILPLRKDLHSIAVVGANAAVYRPGGYPPRNTSGESPLDNIKSAVADACAVEYAQGCALRSDSHEFIPEAVEKARAADAVIVVAGNANGHGWKDAGENTEGEEHDRCRLELPGAQEALIEAVCNVNDRVVVVLINGSAIVMTHW